MIWYNEQIDVQDAPAGSSVRLCGVYNSQEDQIDSAIQLKVEVLTGPDDTALVFTIYSHNPRGLGHQDTPIAEDIRDRYAAKILKARTKLQTSKFNELSSMKPIQ